MGFLAIYFSQVQFLVGTIHMSVCNSHSVLRQDCPQIWEKHILEVCPGNQKLEIIFKTLKEERHFKALKWNGKKG